MALPRFYALVARRIMLGMTRHKHTHTGLVTPSPLDRWIDAMLQLFAMLVSSVASTLQMTRRRLAAECHSDVTPAGLPRETTDTHQETEPAAQHRSPIALMLSSAQSVRPSKGSQAVREADELVQWTNSSGERPERQRRAGVLTTVSLTHNGSVHPVYASPAKAGVQSQTQSARSAQNPFAQSLDPGLRRGCVLNEHASKP